MLDGVNNDADGDVRMDDADLAHVVNDLAAVLGVGIPGDEEDDEDRDEDHENEEGNRRAAVQISSSVMAT